MTLWRKGENDGGGEDLDTAIIGILRSHFGVLWLDPKLLKDFLLNAGPLADEGSTL